MTFQQFQSICDFYYLLYKAAHWQYEVLDRLSFKDAAWYETPVKERTKSNMVYISLLWRKQNHALLSQVSPYNPEDWTELARLSNLLPESIGREGIRVSSRCLLMWNILTSKSGRVHQNDLQQLLCWKNSISRDHPLEISSLDFNQYGFSAFKEKTFCDLKCLPLLQDGCVEHFRNKKPNNPIHDSLNPWLSLPVANISKGLHVKMACGSKQDNIFNQVWGSNQICDKSRPNCRLDGIACKHTGTQTTCEVQIDNCKSFSITNKDTEHRPKQEDITFSLTKHFCNIGSQSRTDSNCWNTQNSVSSGFLNRLLEWEEKVLFNIEDLLTRAQAILEEEEYVLNQKKSMNLPHDQQQQPEYYSKPNVNEDYAILQNDGCSVSTTSDSSKEYHCDLQIKNQKYLHGIFHELEEVYAVDQRIMEENQKIREFHELMQREVTEEQETLFKQVKEKIFFLNSIDRETHHVENLEKSLAREEAKKHHQLRKKEQMDKFKKYCQSVVRENIRLLTEPKCHLFKVAEPEHTILQRPKNKITA